MSNKTDQSEYFQLGKVIYERDVYRALRVFIVGLAALLSTSCFHNAPFQVTAEEAIRFDKDAPYDLAFVEFSERGNVFNRSLYRSVLQAIESRHKDEKTAVIVFAHGWHHNASEEDPNGNLAEFRKLLASLSDNKDGPLRDHRVVGLYLGWRGESIDLFPLNYLTIFERKTVAEGIGSGGATELFLSLARLSICGTLSESCNVSDEVNKRSKRDKPQAAEKSAFSSPDHRLIILGHSLGAALSFSALSDIFIERLVNSDPRDVGECQNSAHDKYGRWSEKSGRPCVVAERFADAVILINPAIEANQALPIKEIMTEHQYPDEQRILMHVLGSESDWAVRRVFPVAQVLTGLKWNDTTLKRKYQFGAEKSSAPRDSELSETRLSIHSIANYSPFRTGWIGADETGYRRCWDEVERPQCVPSEEHNRMPIGPNEPIQFYLTDKGLIDGHNGWEGGNCRLEAYILTVIEESIATGLRKNFDFTGRFREHLRKCNR